LIAEITNQIAINRKMKTGFAAGFVSYRSIHIKLRHVEVTHESRVPVPEATGRPACALADGGSIK
jgi:hypothetical protein